MPFWKKKTVQSTCEHVFEVLTKGKVEYFNAGRAGVDAESFHVKTATCIHCGHSEVLSKVKVRYCDNSELIEVHRDPRGIYTAKLSN